MMDISINIDIHKKIGNNMTKDVIIAIVVCKDSWFYIIGFLLEWSFEKI